MTFRKDQILRQSCQATKVGFVSLLIRIKSETKIDDYHLTQMSNINRSSDIAFERNLTRLKVMTDFTQFKGILVSSQGAFHCTLVTSLINVKCVLPLTKIKDDLCRNQRYGKGLANTAFTIFDSGQRGGSQATFRL